MAEHTGTMGDPKWWPARIRYAILANICLFVFMGNCYVSGITTGFEAMATEFRVDFGLLTDLVSWAVFALGVSNLFWMPLATSIGKRPCILISMLVFLGGTIWSFKAKTEHSLLGARIVASFGAGSIESLGPSIIADIFMERYFSTAMALFALFLSGGSQIGPVIAGYITADQGWRWFFKLCAILNGLNILTMALFLPETSYRRSYALDGETMADVDKEASEMIENAKVDKTAERAQTDDTYARAGSYWKDLVTFADRGQESTGLRAFPKQFSLTFRFLLIPAALYAALAYGVILGGIVLISSQTPQLFSPPPYLLDSKSIGLYSLSSFIGIVISYPLAGPATDLLSQTMTRRNRGVHKPEHRIPALIVPFLLVPSGLILFAWTVAEQKSIYVTAVGYSLQASGLCFVPSVVLSYVVDAYATESGEALVLINAGKNLVAFGITKVNAEWLANQGLKKMYAELAGIQWAILLLAVPLFFFGPWLRAKTLRFI